MQGGVGAPRPPAFGTREHLLRRGPAPIWVRHCPQQAGIGGRKRVGFAQLTHGDVLRGPFADARQRSEVGDRLLEAALSAYFKGDLDALKTIEWRIAGTPFQQKVWKALPKIPAGKTMSYGALATKLGSPNAMRAVGHANGSNPISGVIPCHRLIAANGALVKYGSGLARKRWLLEHEGVALKPGV